MIKKIINKNPSDAALNVSAMICQITGETYYRKIFGVFVQFEDPKDLQQPHAPHNGNGHRTLNRLAQFGPVYAGRREVNKVRDD